MGTTGRAVDIEADVEVAEGIAERSMEGGEEEEEVPRTVPDVPSNEDNGVASAAVATASAAVAGVGGIGLAMPAPAPSASALKTPGKARHGKARHGKAWQDKSSRA